MQVLVTGATGKVGNAVARALAARGDAVRALVRDPGRARAILPEQWLADPSQFEMVNAHGAQNVARVARSAGVRRLVHTSTIDVFHAGRGERFDESNVADYPKHSAYERSKQKAEQLVLAERGGDMEVVVVNPSAVYGPGPAASASLDGEFIRPVIEKQVPALPPGGFGVVYVDGAAEGHLLAAERGTDGERYILCDRHVSLRGLAEAVVRAAHRGRVPPTIPVPAAHALSLVGERVARAVGKAPLLPRGQLLFFLWDAAPDSSKAQDELGWEPTLLEDGLARAVAAL